MILIIYQCHDVWLGQWSFIITHNCTHHGTVKKWIKKIQENNCALPEQLHTPVMLLSSDLRSVLCDAITRWPCAQVWENLRGGSWSCPLPRALCCLSSIFSVMNAMLWWGLRSQCFIWDLASNFEQELVPQPLLSYLPPTPTVVLLRLNSECLP